MDEQIIQALEKIQEICKSTSCVNCPFNDGDENCSLQDNPPSMWTLNKPDDIYHYFR